MVLVIQMKSSINKINRKFGRRAHDRFSIPGATVSWINNGKKNFPEESTPLSDISMSGLSLLTNNPPEENSDICIRINFPKEPGQLKLYGSTVYSIFRGPGLTYEYRVGVKLSPFSETEGDNSPESQKVLAQLEQMYGKHLETQDFDD